jgi:CRP-like cAMP-binding protein
MTRKVPPSVTLPSRVSDSASDCTNPAEAAVAMMDDGRHARPHLTSGDHAILVYEDKADFIAFVLPFIKKGLADRDRCLYIIAESKRADILAALSAGGVRVDREVKSGALAFVTPREYYGPMPLDPPRIVHRLEEQLRHALAAGFAGVRIIAEMSWAGRQGVPDEILSDYESLLEMAYGHSRATFLCVYRRDAFDPAMLERLVRTHAKVVAEDYVYLSLSTLFRDLARTDLQRLAQSARESAVRKGEFFFREGDSAMDAYLLTAGMVKLVRTDAEGRGVILRIVAPTEAFGDRVVALGESHRLSSAQAMEDSRALTWDGPALLRVVLAHPAVSLSALRLLEERVEKERSRILDFVSPDVRRRLARLLLRLGQSIGRRTRRGLVINVPFSREDLAELVISSPYTVSRILADWRRVDTVDAQRARIIVRDPKRLAEIAGVHVDRQ